VKQNRNDNQRKETGEEADPVRAREYFKGLIGKWTIQWGLREENYLLRPER
jgi:hypothetical protein